MGTGRRMSISSRSPGPCRSVRVAIAIEQRGRAPGAIPAELVTQLRSITPSQAASIVRWLQPMVAQAKSEALTPEELQTIRTKGVLAFQGEALANAKAKGLGRAGIGIRKVFLEGGSVALYEGKFYAGLLAKASQYIPEIRQRSQGGQPVRVRVSQTMLPILRTVASRNQLAVMSLPGTNVVLVGPPQSLQSFQTSSPGRQSSFRRSA
jgi:hypothetical protein